MGIYINPREMDKEDWLAKYMIGFGRITANGYRERPFNCLPVILIDNGLFTAAGVAYDQREYAAFTDPNPKDRRPKKMFYVPIENLTADVIGEDNVYLIAHGRGK